MTTAKNGQGNRWMRLLVGVGISLSFHTVVAFIARLGPIRSAEETEEPRVDHVAALAWFTVPSSPEMQAVDETKPKNAEKPPKDQSPPNTHRPSSAPQDVIAEKPNNDKVSVDEETGRPEDSTEFQDASELLRRRPEGRASAIARVLDPTSSPFAASHQNVFRVVEGAAREQDILSLPSDRHSPGDEGFQKLLPFAQIAGARWRDHIQSIPEPTLVDGASAATRLLLGGAEGWRAYHAESSRPVSSTSKAKSGDNRGLEPKRQDCLVEVHLKPSGPAEVELLQSSGDYELDRAALRIAEEEATFSRDSLRHLGIASIKYRFGLEERVNLPLCRGEQEGMDSDRSGPRFSQAKTISCGLQVDQMRPVAPFSTTRKASVKIVDYELGADATVAQGSPTSPGSR